MHRLLAALTGLVLALSLSSAGAISSVPFFVGGASASAGAQAAPVWAWRASDLSLAPYIGSGTPTVTRAGNTATRINSSGLIETVNANLARYDYSLAGVLQGLLVEPAATNIALRNNDLTNAVWVKGATASVAKDQTGPDGVVNSASRITGGAVNTTNTVLQTVVLASSSRKMSAYVKRLVGTGTIEMTTNGGTNWDAIVPTASWVRYDIAVRTLANPSFGFRVNTNTDQIAVAFIQNETDVLTSPTTETAGAAVTRAADVVQLAVSSISGFNNNALGVYVRHISHAGAVVGAANPATICFRTDDSNYLLAYRLTASTNFRVDVVTGGVAQISLVPGTESGGEDNKTMFAVAANDFAAVLDGGTVATDTSGTVPDVSAGTMQLGGYPTLGTLQWRGHLKEVEIYGTRPSNGYMQTKTTP